MSDRVEAPQTVTEEQLIDMRSQIKGALAEPMIEIVYMHYYWVEGIHVPPDNRILLTELTLEKAEKFYQVLREELENVRDTTEFSTDLAESLDSDSENQSTFDHEVSHVRVAQEKGVKLEECQLEAFFLTGSGLGFAHQFIPPPNTDPLTMVYIALAPERPSSADLQVVKKTIREHPEILGIDPTINDLFFQKTGKNLDLV